jgi:hypothetical protein
LSRLRGDQSRSLLQVRTFPQISDPALESIEGRTSVPDTHRETHTHAD